MFRRTQASLLLVMAGIFFAAVTLLPTTARATGDCLASPAGVASSGKHWYYRLNRVTQQKCWYLGMKRPTVRSVALRKSSKTSVAAGRLSSSLPPSIADAQASIQHTVNEATARSEIASSEAGVAKEVTYEDLLRSTFGSRWADPVDTARPTGLQSGRRSLAVAGFEARSFEAADRLVANASSPADALGILLAAAGSALVLLGLCGRLFLAQRDQSSTPEYPTPLHLPNFESASEDPTYANAQGDLDASAERDLYGIPSATLAVQRSVADGAGSGHAATPLFTPGKNRPSISTAAAHEPQRLAETAVE
jgi:hypothetical protein